MAKSSKKVQVQARRRGHVKETDWFEVDIRLSPVDAGRFLSQKADDMIFEYRTAQVFPKSVQSRI